MEDTLKISVGIPAYNEEGNIGFLIESILSQKETGWSLLEIIISSDASTDNTKGIVSSYKDDRITFIDNSKREGQAVRQNQIVQKFVGDVLILLNADVIPNGQDFITNFIKPFSKDSKVGLVGCLNKTLKAETFIEKIINKSIDLKNEIFVNLNNGQNVYSCHGHARAFSKELAKQIAWPYSVGEDAYSYFYCLEKGFSFAYNSEVSVSYRSPQTLADHYKQSLRFTKSQNDISKLFPSVNISEQYTIPKKLLLTTLVKFWIQNPVLITGYILLQLAGKFKRVEIKISDTWEVSESSKKLFKK